ncbi:MAG: hypothetical protein HY904_02850 [Deltaproteobacteria bacterium]|nr:hypothetical protein [Deltaproteobacteria bacterium]
MKRLVGADGSTRQIGFHDQTLDIDCDFVRTEAGDFLCAPVSGAGLLEPSAARTFGQYYADPACTEPLASSDLGSDKLKYIVEGRGTTVFVDIAVLGRVLAPGAEHLGSLYFKQSPTTGTCGVYARTNTHYYRYGSDVSLSTFAAATVSME